MANTNFKTKVYRDRRYLEWIRSLNCTVCRRPAPSHAHHEGKHGMSIKADDLETLPLCTECHFHRHNMGVLSFWAKAGRDPKQVIKMLQDKYKVLTNDR